MKMLRIPDFLNVHGNNFLVPGNVVAKRFNYNTLAAEGLQNSDHWLSLKTTFKFDWYDEEK